MSNWNQPPTGYPQYAQQPAAGYGAPAPAQGAPSAYDAVFARLSGAKEQDSIRDPFFEPGAHECIIAVIEPFNHSSHGPSVRLVVEVERSTNPTVQPGTFMAKTWNLMRPAKHQNMTTDADDFVAFVCALQNVQLGKHMPSCTALTKTHAEGGQLESQPARGARIRAYGAYTGKPNEKTGKPYVKLQWTHVPQDLATTARTRAELDQRRPIGAPAGAAPNIGGQPAQTVTGNVYGQPAAPAPQAPPQMPPPGYGPPPGYPQAPAPQMPPPGVQAAPQGYPQAPAAAPTGGYVAMLPPNGYPQR